ncbi:hypothetical protein ColTof4_13790 [Colletotrichum tofieldiae]|nr:hypothetical protein ColTof4_13790 [Colletotrichum tofieldiae]GKT84053.1 hypothetical protein Ct61P_01903 [Colletotrichum tofieldiae]
MFRRLASLDGLLDAADRFFATSFMLCVAHTYASIPIHRYYQTVTAMELWRKSAELAEVIA